MFLKKKIFNLANPVTTENFGWQTSNKVFRLFINVALTSAIARIFGPDNFGVLSFSLTFIGIFALLTTLGTNRILQREIISAKNKKNEEEILTTILLIRESAATIFLIICTTMAYIFYYEFWIIIFILSFTLLFDFNETIDLYFQSVRKSKKPIVVRLVAFIFGSAIKAAMLIAGTSLVVFTISYTIEAMLAGLLLIRLLISYKKNIKLYLNKSISIGIIKESWTEIAAGLFNLLTLKSGLILSEYFLNHEQVGYYGAAQRLSETWLFIPLSLIASLYPSLVKSKNSNQYFLRYELLTTILVIMTYLVISFSLFFGEGLISLIYGSAYLASTNTFIILTAASLFILLGSTSGVHLSIERKMYINMIRNFVAVGISYTGCIIFIPIYGIEAGAISTLLAFALSFFIMDIFFESTKRIFIIKLRCILIIPSIMKFRNSL